MMKVALFFTGFCLLALAVASPLKKESDLLCSVDTSCGKSSYDVMDLKVSFSPDPPQQGNNLTITASGTVNKQITGGKIEVLAKYYGITVLNQSYKVCNLAQRMGKQCPIPAGPLSDSVTVQVPTSVPKGTYSVSIKGTDQDGKNMICANIKCQA